jgi:prepilin-type N-terminal cleavage/methylation domain-containing protein
MKTITSDGCRVSGDETVNAVCSRHASRLTRHSPLATRHSWAFTLIELLTVIAIIGVIAALILPVAGAVKKHQYLYNTQTEMAQLETAIDRYKATYGFYPPDNQLNPPTSIPNPLVNQLYYELVGTVYTNTAAGTVVYAPLDGSSPLPATYVSQAFGVGGFMNCTKPNGGEDASVAKSFLSDLKPNQITTTSNNVLVTILICSVGGPEVTYQPLNQQDGNPWRYNSSSPTNNPGSYDLWVQLVIGKQTNLVCNWTKQVQINSPLP